MKRKTNFERYLETQMKDADFVKRYQEAGEAWDVALQLAALRKEAGLYPRSKDPCRNPTRKTFKTAGSS